MIKIKNNRKDIFRIILTALITVVVVVTLRILVFASFKVPSFSMEPTLLAGDFILVNKLVPGPRIDILGNNEAGRPVRLTGYEGIQRNNVLVFNDPYYRSKDITQKWSLYYVKRCVGMPGDTLRIQDGTYYVNGRLNNASRRSNHSKMQKFGMAEDVLVPGRFKELGWTIQQFGPIYIPRKGDGVMLDSSNIRLYRPLIEYETGKKLMEMKGTFMLDGQVCRHYQFKLNYYFMAGDRATDSKDSRYWGLLPEDHIVGKVSYIWKSKDPHTNKYRFNRFFKPVE